MFRSVIQGKLIAIILVILSQLLFKATAHYTLETTDYVCQCDDWHFDECSQGWAYGWPGRSFSENYATNGEYSGVDGVMTIQYNEYQVGNFKGASAARLKLTTEGMEFHKYTNYKPATKRPGSKTILRHTLNNHYYFSPEPLEVYWTGFAQPLGSDINDCNSWPLKSVADVYNKGSLYKKFSYVENMVNSSFPNTHSHHSLTVPNHEGVYQFVMTWKQTLYANPQLQEIQWGISTNVYYYNVFHIIVDQSASASVPPCYKTCKAPKLACGHNPGACYDPSQQQCREGIIIDKSICSDLSKVKICYGWDGSKRAYNSDKVDCIMPKGATPYKNTFYQNI